MRFSRIQKNSGAAHTSRRGGEVHAIGFDTDDNTSPEYSFNVYGSQTWAIEDFKNYDPNCGRLGCRETYNLRPAVPAIDCPEQVSGMFFPNPDVVLAD